jgi:hypothetical protein
VVGLCGTRGRSNSIGSATTIPNLQSWAVRLDAPNPDWTWEREWRIVRSPAVALHELALVGLLVGAASWTGVRYANCVSAATGQLESGNFFPPLPPGLPRFLWNYSNADFEQLPHFSD